MYIEGQDSVNSPASSMDRNMAELTEALFSQPSQDIPPPQLVHDSTDAVLLGRFSTMLQQELSKACTTITTDLKKDIHSLGERFELIETKVGNTIKKVNQNSAMSQTSKTD